MTEDKFIALNMYKHDKHYFNIENGLVYTLEVHNWRHYYKPLTLWLIDGVKCIWIRTSQGGTNFLEYSSLVNDHVEKIHVPINPTRNKWTYPRYSPPASDFYDFDIQRKQTKI